MAAGAVIIIIIIIYFIIPIDRAIMSLSGFGVSFMWSTIFLMGLSVFLAMNDAGMMPQCLLTLFRRFADDDFFVSSATLSC